VMDETDLSFVIHLQNVAKIARIACGRSRDEGGRAGTPAEYSHSRGCKTKIPCMRGDGEWDTAHQAREMGHLSRIVR